MIIVNYISTYKKSARYAECKYLTFVQKLTSCQLNLSWYGKYVLHLIAVEILAMQLSASVSKTCRQWRLVNKKCTPFEQRFRLTTLIIKRTGALLTYLRRNICWAAAVSSHGRVSLSTLRSVLRLWTSHRLCADGSRSAMTLNPSDYL